MGFFTLLERVVELERRMTEVEEKAEKRIAVSIRRLANKKASQDWASLTPDQKARRQESARKYRAKKKAMEEMGTPLFTNTDN